MMWKTDWQICQNNAKFELNLTKLASNNYRVYFHVFNFEAFIKLMLGYNINNI